MKKLTLAVLVAVLVVGAFSLVAAFGDGAVLRLGIFTDLHAHDTDSPTEGKFMTEYPARLTACIEAMNAWPADLVIELGDFVNGNFVVGAPLGDSARIPGILDKAEAIYAQFDGPRYYVLGNHDVYDLSKDEFLSHTGAAWTYGSFDAGAYHFVILDAQYDKKGKDLSHAGWVVQGNIPQAERDWLAADLAQTDRPTIVCVHQRLDVDHDFLSGGGPEIIGNKLVQEILENAGVVIAVFQGHEHKNAHTVINGIHYITFDQLTDEDESKPSWAYVTLDPAARTIDIKGAGDQADWHLEY